MWLYHAVSQKTGIQTFIVTQQILHEKVQIIHTLSKTA